MGLLFQSIIEHSEHLFANKFSFINFLRNEFVEKYEFSTKISDRGFTLL